MRRKNEQAGSCRVERWEEIEKRGERERRAIEHKQGATCILSCRSLKEELSHRANTATPSAPTNTAHKLVANVRADPFVSF